MLLPLHALIIRWRRVRGLDRPARGLAESPLKIFDTRYELIDC